MTSYTKLGDWVHQRRRKLGVLARQLAHEHHVNVAEWQRLEAGLRPGPQAEEYQARLARVLRISPRSPDYVRLVRLCAESVAQVPAPETLTEAQVVRKLPVHVHTTDGKPLSEAQARELAEVIRRQETPDPQAADDTLFTTTEEPS